MCSKHAGLCPARPCAVSSAFITGSSGAALAVAQNDSHVFQGMKEVNGMLVAYFIYGFALHVTLTTIAYVQQGTLDDSPQAKWDPPPVFLKSAALEHSHTRVCTPSLRRLRGRITELRRGHGDSHDLPEAGTIY